MKKINEQIAQRWSPRSFTPREVTSEQIELLVEAAGRAPSSMNEQPWFFYYALKGEQGFDKMLSCLNPGNSSWAKDAGALILVVSRNNYTRGNRHNTHSMYDTGAASALLALQAVSMGLQVHQMGGFDGNASAELFGLDIDVETPAVFIAVGYPDPADPAYDSAAKRPASARKLPAETMKHYQ